MTSCDHVQQHLSGCIVESAVDATQRWLPAVLTGVFARSSSHWQSMSVESVLCFSVHHKSYYCVLLKVVVQRAFKVFITLRAATPYL